jgi:peptidyl-prolyl cis-trans isomerase B (cyclophilin B)
MKQLEKPKSGDKIATIFTNFGDIKIKLLPEAAPKAVENFITHSENGYYDGVIFHRVIKDFMIQGGDPTGTGRGGESIWVKPFKDECNLAYRNITGALSMANAGPGTNGSQFFIVNASPLGDELISQMRELGEKGGYPDDVVDAYENMGGAYWLDMKHTVFGQVFDGMEVVKEISETQTDSYDKPLKDVVIEKIAIETL